MYTKNSKMYYDTIASSYFTIKHKIYLFEYLQLELKTEKNQFRTLLCKNNQNIYSCQPC